MSKASKESRSRYERAIFTLPPELLEEARKFADAFHNGNNSGFVATAIRNYIEYLRKVRHTAKLRESYAASAAAARDVAKDWDAVSDETWALLDRPKRKRT